MDFLKRDRSVKIKVTVDSSLGFVDPFSAPDGMARAVTIMGPRSYPHDALGAVSAHDDVRRVLRSERSFTLASVRCARTRIRRRRQIDCYFVGVPRRDDFVSNELLCFIQFQRISALQNKPMRQEVFCDPKKQGQRRFGRSVTVPENHFGHVEGAEADRVDDGSAPPENFAGRTFTHNLTGGALCARLALSVTNTAGSISIAAPVQRTPAAFVEDTMTTTSRVSLAMLSNRFGASASPVTSTTTSIDGPSLLRWPLPTAMTLQLPLAWPYPIERE